MYSRFATLAWLTTTFLCAGCGTAAPSAASPRPGSDGDQPTGGFSPCADEPGEPPAAKPAPALTFGLTMTAQLPDPIGGEPLAVQPGDALPTGAQVSFAVAASAEAHLYAFQVAPGGAASALFPASALGLANPLPAGGASRIPPGEAAFKLDDEDLGETRLYFVVSATPLPELVAALQAVADGKVVAVTDSTALQKVAAVAPPGQAPECQPLDLGVPPGEGCRQPIGEDLRASLTAGAAPGGIEGDSLLLRTPADQSVIVAVLPFDHVPLAKYKPTRTKATSRGIIMED